MSLAARPRPFPWRCGTARVRTPTVLQMEALECGAAALGIVLAYYRRDVPLEELRLDCGVSRDGSKAGNLVRAARRHGLLAEGYSMELEDLGELTLPFIVFWQFNHFVVVEGFGNGKVYLNDPSSGHRCVNPQEFDRSFTGVVLSFTPGPEFVKTRPVATLLPALRRRLAGSEAGLVFAVLASLFLVVPGLVVPALTQTYVDTVLVEGRTDGLLPLLGGLAVMAVLRGLLTLLQRFALLRLETRLTLAGAGTFFWHVLRLPIEFYAQRFAGEISGRVAINDRLARLLSGQLASTMLGVLVIVFYAVVMFRYDVVLTLVGIATAALNVLVLHLVSAGRVDANRRLLLERGKLLGASINGLQVIETLKATGAESDFFSRWGGIQARAVNAAQELVPANQMLTMAPPLLSALNTVVILALGGLRVMEGVLTLGQLIAFQGLMANFLGPVARLVQLGGTLQEAQGDMQRLDDVLRYPVQPIVAGSGTADQGRLSGAMEFRDVTFGYNRLEPPLIESFSLHLPAGARIALVGGTGSGKSTVARLVAGLYEPWSGEILLDGRPRRTIPRDVLTGSLAMVDQDIFLFEGSVRDNVTMWDATIPESALIQALKDAELYDDIAARPGGLDGRVAEGGHNFSGGQRQRLEIARALATDPTILVLDEATSALDPLTEAEIDENLRRRGCTCLIIAHRLSTIRDCDEIFVLDRGKVVERGTHDAMRRRNGPYGRLIRSESVSIETTKTQSLLERLL